MPPRTVTEPAYTSRRARKGNPYNYWTQPGVSYSNPRKAYRSKASQSLSVKRTVVSIVACTGPGFDDSANYYFEMTQMPGFSEITAMFTKIKLQGVRLRWCPAFSDTLAGATSISKTMLVAVNTDNVTTVPTLGSLRERNNVMIKAYDKGFSVKLKPVLKNQVGQAGLLTYYTDTPCNKVTLSPANAGVRFYGLDWSIADTGLPATTILGKWEIIYTVKCSSPK